MRKYELMTIFPAEEEKYNAGLATLRSTLSEYGVEIEKEESFGDRDLCYEVKKQKRGRFLLLIIKANTAKVVELNRQFKLNPELLKCMFVKIDE